MSRSKTITEALKYVSNHPQPSTDDMTQTPTWELVGRRLFEIANNPDVKVRGSMARATRAQKIILDRLVGTRRAGTHPAQVKSDEIDFVDLTVGVLDPNLVGDGEDE